MRWTLLAAGLLAILFAAPAAADKRVALVVGNSTYQNVSRLQNPKGDAQLVAETLQRLGFALVGGQAQVDLDKAGFDAAIQRFGSQLMGADVALFYYAGHGIEVIQADQLGLVQAIEQLGAVLGHLGQRQIDRRLATLLETQAGRLQQMAAPDTVGAPQIDQALRPAGIGFAQALDIAERRSIGARVEVGKGGVVAQADAQGKLDGFHG